MKTVSHIGDVSFQQLISYSDKFRSVRICANVDPKESYNLSREIEMASEMGADGLGVINTDNIFLKNRDALTMLRTILVKKSREARSYNDDPTMSMLGDLYRLELVSIFRQSHMKGTVQVKLLDLSLSTFLPKLEEENQIISLAMHLNISVSDLKSTIGSINLSFSL